MLKKKKKKQNIVTSEEVTPELVTPFFNDVCTLADTEFNTFFLHKDESVFKTLQNDRFFSWSPSLIFTIIIVCPITFWWFWIKIDILVNEIQFQKREKINWYNIYLYRENFTGTKTNRTEIQNLDCPVYWLINTF